MRFTFHWYMNCSNENIRYMHTVWTNQIADILHLKNISNYLIKRLSERRPCRRTALFQLGCNVVWCRITSYTRWNDVVCVWGYNNDKNLCRFIYFAFIWRGNHSEVLSKKGVLFASWCEFTLRKKSPNSELFCPYFPHSDQNNSEYWHFSRSDIDRSPHLRRTAQNARIMILCLRSVFIFKEQVSAPAHFTMFFILLCQL